jgi:hypothetical protein
VNNLLRYWYLYGYQMSFEFNYNTLTCVWDAKGLPYGEPATEHTNMMLMGGEL